jgi:hypothetical protein
VKYIMVMVNTGAKQVNIEALRIDLYSASLHINVTYPLSCFRLPFAS